jgi:magnesium-transporting ATPase (P-type)
VTVNNQAMPPQAKPSLYVFSSSDRELGLPHDPAIPHRRAVKGHSLAELDSKATGLSVTEAAQRLATNGPNQLQEGKHISSLQILLGQFKSIIIWIPIAAGAISAVLGEVVDAGAILAIVEALRVLGSASLALAPTALQCFATLIVATNCAACAQAKQTCMRSRQKRLKSRQSKGAPLKVTYGHWLNTTFCS